MMDRLARLHHLVPFRIARQGRAERRLDASVERVFAALMADPLPGELARWRMTEYVRHAEDHATYKSRGRPTEARFTAIDPPRRLRWVSTSGMKVQTLDYELDADEVDGGTRLCVHATLSFRVRPRHMAKVLEELLDGVEARVRLEEWLGEE